MSWYFFIKGRVTLGRLVDSNDYTVCFYHSKSNRISLNGLSLITDLCPRLRHLGVHLQDIVCPSQFEQNGNATSVLNLFKKLNSLSITNCHFKDMEFLSNLNLRNRLTLLRLSGSSSLSIKSLVNFTHLKVLEIVRNNQLKTETMIHATKPMKFLRRVNFSFTPVSSAVINALLLNNSYMDELNVSHNSILRLTDLNVTSYSLSYFDCSFTKLTDSEGVRMLPSLFPNLVHLDVSFCCRLEFKKERERMLLVGLFLVKSFFYIEG